MAFTLDTISRKKFKRCGLISVILGQCILLQFIQQVSCASYTINTNDPAEIIDETNGFSQILAGQIVQRSFKGPNGELWNHSIAQFTLSEDNKNIFKLGNTVQIKGNNSLSLSTSGNFTVSTTLDVSGREVEGLQDTLFVLGGFVRTSNSCCVLGAGPGAAFSFHGAGHGGRGGGFYQDRNTSRYYSWEYYDTEYLLGGSTSTVMFESKPGSGGGAIEIIVKKGVLLIDAPIKANGFTSSNTSSEDHCAGGSSGGLIRLKGTTVKFGSIGDLSARGGHSGFSSKNDNHRCGDGGGGGVIQVFSTYDDVNYLSDKKRLHINGGNGLDKGEPGIVFLGVLFTSGTLEINTTDCTMKWMGILLHNGSLSPRTFRTPDDKMNVRYEVCTFVFQSSVHIATPATINVKGKNSLKIVSKNGNVEMLADIDLSEKTVGGFSLTNLAGVNAGPGNVTGCNSTGLYENDFDTLIGGSVCNQEAEAGIVVNVIGGGAIELEAEMGAVVIGKKITTDGYSNNDKAGAMGGFIRLRGKEVHLKSSAVLSAKASSTGRHLASGGIIQIKSDNDVVGMCETKFDVTGGSNGLVNIMVSSKSSYQVQFIQDGQLQVNTTLCMWVHKTLSNYSVAYSQYGNISTQNEVTVCSFAFNTPIILNGSAEVQLSGQHALSIDSTQGIYIGADMGIDSNMKVGMSSFLGGSCVVEENQAKEGAGPGKGFPNTNAGGGHGGRGGLFREANGTVYGKQYGVTPYWFIGGSTGTSSDSGLRGCGGGAIRITSKRNLTIDAAIRANGYASPLFDGVVGGSSGGSIFLEAKRVIFKSRAVLEAKGSDATSFNDTGGGGGGVIVINSTTSALEGKAPNVTIATAGGQGYKPGECGAVIINGAVHRKQHHPGVELSAIFTGCYSIALAKMENIKEHKMLEHQALPSMCLKHCKEKLSSFALINGKSCYCMSQKSLLETPDSNLCKKPCPASYKYRCGGENPNEFSVYSTGIQAVSPTTPAPVEPTTRPSEQASTEFVTLNNVSITTENSQKVVQDLLNLTIKTDLNVGDTQAAVNIMTKLGGKLAPKNPIETKQAGQAIVQTASVLLGSKNIDSWQSLESKNETARKPYSPNNILDVIEKIAVALGSGLAPEETIAVESNHLVMGIERRDLDGFKGGRYPRYEKLSEKWQFEDFITIPEESVVQLKKNGASHTTIVFILYNGIEDALQSNLENDRMINSRVLALKFDQQFTEPFKKPVVMTLTKRQNWENLTDPQCSFLDFKNSSYGVWSNHGCIMTSAEGDPKVQCECNHLTNFAVLMQVKKFDTSRSHEKALEMITYIGCGISLFGLALTLATFLSLETLASERTSIHKNLVVAIGLAQIIFLAGIDAVYNPIACKIVALALHYLYMAAFTWMCCEGIHLYTKVIEVFSSETSKMKYYYMLGWGVPLIIVIISAASRMSGYGTETACWISITHGLIWAFVGPVLIIMCINFIVMVMVIKVILASVTSIQTPGNTSQVKAGLKGMVVLLPLLGLTWVFGLMAVNEKTIAFQYVFAILNSLQGLFIFAFHCIGNSEVRIAYKRLHEKRTLAKMPEHSLSSGNHHKNVEEFKRRMNSRETNSTGDEDIIVTKAIRSVSDVKLSGAQDHVAMQTFGDADSGRWSLNCPSPDPPSVTYQPDIKSPPGRDPRSAPVLSDAPQPTTPRESYRSNRNNVPERNRFVQGEEGQANGYQRF